MALELKYPIRLLCQIAGVNRAAYYMYKKRPLDKNAEIENLIVDIYNKLPSNG